MDLNDLRSQAQAAHAGVSLANGQRVIDAVTSEPGTIKAGLAVHRRVEDGQFVQLRSNTPAIASQRLELFEQYLVRLDTGELVTRERAQLVPISAGVNPTLEDFV